VLAYARMVLPALVGSHEAAMLDAMAGFCRVWAPLTYDAVFYLPDRYQHPADPMRAKVDHLQAETADAVRDTCADVGLPLLDVPRWARRGRSGGMDRSTGRPAADRDDRLVTAEKHKAT
jgi:hypothetical protein